MAEGLIDVLVVGGGPAGSTLATLVKKHDPSARVVLLEKSAFPRHHVGESLLPGMVHVLKEMGVYQTIKDYGFPRKFGAVFVWGRDREPWDADFIQFGQEVLEKYGDVLTDESSWQVVRADYDHLLLEHARATGVEVRAARAVEPIDDGGRVAGVVLEGGERLRAALVADCSGQNGFLSKFRPVRRYREDLRHVAGWSYYRGAKWKFEYTGYPDKTKIFVCSVPEGWFWYIPISRDMVSVGLVSKSSAAAARGGSYRDYFLSALKACPELWPLVQDAETVTGMDAAEPARDFFTVSDWSFESETAHGPGWVAAGDAAFFIDPLLSSGVTLAHLGAHRAAYTILTARREKDPALERALWADYDEFCRGISGAFLDLVKHWYGSHPNPDLWFESARGALKAAAPLHLSAKGSFIGVITGAYAHYERAYADPSGLYASNRRAHAAWNPPTSAEAGPRATGFRDETVPRWLAKTEVRDVFVPVSGAGRLAPIACVRFSAAGTDPVDAFARPRRRLLPAAHLAIVEAVDGKRDARAIKARVRALLPLPADAVDAQVERLLLDLEGLGVLELTGAASAPEPAPAELSLLRRGEDLLKRGAVAEAEGALDRAVKAGEGGRWALALRGEARRHLQRLDEARADLDAALAPPASPAGADRREALRAAFEESVRRGWYEDRARASRAQLRLAAGDMKGAVEDADAALRLNPGQFDALRVRAQARRALGDLAGSLADLEAVRAMLGRPAR